MDASSIPWPAIPVIFALAVAGTVYGLQKVKMLAYSSKRWTRKIPKWTWLVLSIVLPFGLVIFLAQPWAFGWMNQFLPESMRVDIGPQEMLGIGVGAIFGSGGSYSVAKKLGMTGDYADIPNGYEKSQSGNVTTQSGNVAGANAAGSATAGNQTEGSPATATLPRKVTAQVCDLQTNAVDSHTSDAHLFRYQSLPEGYVVLTPDGRLYIMHHGEMEHLGRGWNNSQQQDHAYTVPG